MGEFSMVAAASMRRFFETVNSGEIDGLIELLSDDFVEHEQMPGMPTGREATRQLFKMIVAAFPNMNWDPEDILVDGDKAVARTRFSGTNDGEFMGMPATGKSVSVQVIDVVRFDDDGLAREHWGVFDMLGLMTQLGALPGPPA
jgi:steroid delta-isomerase-like uncharacterized protein